MEIGANPYFLTLLIKKYKNYEFTLINYFGQECKITRQVINNEKYGETHSFDFLNINLEKEKLPYPNGYFDVVIYCEVLEHLIENPIYTLYNIHRIIKEDGVLILSTPNVFRYKNLLKFFPKNKRSFYDPYSGYGIYGRHNREYTIHELEDILSNTGYSIISKKTITIKEKTALNSIFFKIINHFQYGDYLLVKVKKNPTFHYYYPNYLYRGMPPLIISDDYIIFGENCYPHLDEGWHSVEKYNGIGGFRWTKKKASIYLKPKKLNNELNISVLSNYNDYKIEFLVYQNQKLICEYPTCISQGWHTVSFKLPEILLESIKLEIICENEWVPKKMEINSDERELGVGIHEIRLK